MLRAISRALGGHPPLTQWELEAIAHLVEGSYIHGGENYIPLLVIDGLIKCKYVYWEIQGEEDGIFTFRRLRLSPYIPPHIVAQARAYIGSAGPAGKRPTTFEITARQNALRRANVKVDARTRRAVLWACLHEPRPLVKPAWSYDPKYTISLYLPVPPSISAQPSQQQADKWPEVRPSEDQMHVVLNETLDKVPLPEIAESCKALEIGWAHSEYWQVHEMNIWCKAKLAGRLKQYWLTEEERRDRTGPG
jgi:hypothetical protein